MKWNFQHRIIILMVMLLMGITGIQAQHGRKHAAFDPRSFRWNWSSISQPMLP